MDTEKSLGSLEWMARFAEDLNRDIVEATGDPDAAHAAVVLVLTLLAATGPVDASRLGALLDSLEIDGAGIVDRLAEREIIHPVGTGIGLTAAGLDLFETMADAVGGALARSEDLERVRERHLPT